MSEADRLISEAMRVLDEAHRVAASMRAEADRYARDRAANADLVLNKARRVLHAAEEKAGVIVAVARRTEAGAEAPDRVVDLDALAVDVDVDEAVAHAGQSGSPDVDSSLSRLIEAAIGRAVTRAFPSDHTV